MGNVVRRVVRLTLIGTCLGLSLIACSGNSARDSEFCKAARASEPLRAADASPAARLAAVRSLARSAPEELKSDLATVAAVLDRLQGTGQADPATLTSMIGEGSAAARTVEGYLVATCDVDGARLL